MTIKTLDGVKKLLETRILEYKEEIKSENVRNDRDTHNMVDGEILYEDGEFLTIDREKVLFNTRIAEKELLGYEKSGE